MCVCFKRRSISILCPTTFMSSCITVWGLVFQKSQYSSAQSPLCKVSNLTSFASLNFQALHSLPERVLHESIFGNGKRTGLGSKKQQRIYSNHNHPLRVFNLIFQRLLSGGLNTDGFRHSLSRENVKLPSSQGRTLIQKEK